MWLYQTSLCSLQEAPTCFIAEQKLLYLRVKSIMYRRTTFFSRCDISTDYKASVGAAGGQEVMPLLVWLSWSNES